MMQLALSLPLPYILLLCDRCMSATVRRVCAAVLIVLYFHLYYFGVELLNCRQNPIPFLQRYSHIVLRPEKSLLTLGFLG